MYTSILMHSDRSLVSFMSQSLETSQQRSRLFFSAMELEYTAQIIKYKQTNLPVKAF